MILYVQNTQPCLRSIPLACAVDAEVLQLKPGLNPVDAEKWERALKNQTVQALVKSKILVVDKTRTQNGNISELAITKAVKLVMGTYDKDILEGWALAEERAPVLQAIEKQLDLLENKRIVAPENAATADADD